MAQQPPQYTYTPPPPEVPYYNALFAAADKQSTGYLSGQQAVEFLSLSKLPVDLLKQIWTMADQPPSNTLDPQKFYVAVRLIQLFQNGKKPVDLALHLGDGDGAVRPPYFEGFNAQPQQQQQQVGGQQQPSPQMQPAQQQQPSPSPQMQPQPSPQMNGIGGASIMTGAVPPMQQMGIQQTGSFTTTLTVQDPYTMTPAELIRYEALFPSYAQPDDPNNPAGAKFVHGAAAVELFSKSGKSSFVLC